MANKAPEQPPATGANAIHFQSRDEMRKQKELEEARKSGLIPAEKDEEGNDINPHIPQYISKAPWYLSKDAGPSLKHQRGALEKAANSKLDIHNWYQRGLGQRATTFRKGACVNCGATTHQASDCTERPRKLGAKWTSREIAPDELLPEALALGFAGKRDRWGGYDNNTFGLVVREYEDAELERKRRKAEEMQKKMSEAGAKRRKRRKLVAKEEAAANKAAGDNAGEAGDNSDSGGSDSDSDSEGEEDDEEEDARIRDFDEANAVVGTKDDRTRTTTRNLRIREDTAKYLYNLDVNSAFYDPKTRSMRDDPLKNQKAGETLAYKGDNSLRGSGEVAAINGMEVFAWEAYKHGTAVHTQAMPTQLEYLHREHLKKKKELEDAKKEELLERYGGREHLDVPKQLLFAQTESYVEYNPDGSICKGKARELARSRFEEDVHPGDHTAVWGSWFDREAGRWGFACCRGLSRAADCTKE